MSGKLRVGYVPYTNMLPFFHFLERDDRFEWVKGVPSEINRYLANGDIDVGPISAFAYGERWREYVLLDRLCVAADGPVGSIFLISKLPLEQLEGRRIALTASSATSVNLIRIIFSRFYGFNAVSYRTMHPDLPSMMNQADAAVLIADDAIDSLSERGNYYFYDIGQLWKQHTSKPMVYAVMAARESVLEARAEWFRIFHHRLLAAKEKALRNIGRLAAYCQKVRGGEYEYWKDYFSHLRYGFEMDLREGLAQYFSYAYEMGLLLSVPEIRIREAVPLA
jgi:chorismate dehydratase